VPDETAAVARKDVHAAVRVVGVIVGEPVTIGPAPQRPESQPGLGIDLWALDRDDLDDGQVSIPPSRTALPVANQRRRSGATTAGDPFEFSWLGSEAPPWSRPSYSTRLLTGSTVSSADIAGL